MSASEGLKDLVSRIPDPDGNGTYADLDKEKVERIERVVAQLAEGGRDAVLGLIDLCVEPGKGDDGKARFALHLLAVRSTQPGNQRARAALAREIALHVGGARPKAVQAMLIEILQLIGSKAVVGALGKALLDPDLCDAAARALVAIRHGAAEQLLGVFPKVQGASRRSVIAKLAMLKAPQAARAFRQSLADDDPETRIAAAWGLARIADRAAVPAMLKCAGLHAGWERINQTDACMELAENLAAAGAKDAAAAIWTHLAKTRMDPAERHVRAAAEAQLAGPAEAGFRPLFDGKSFEGWRVDENTAKSWKIGPGILALTGGSAHLFTEESFGDFVVRFEWRPLKKGYNSGFFVRGRQIQIADGQAGMLFGSKDAPPVPNLHKPPGEWNAWEVTCVGRTLSLTVNGTLAWKIGDFKAAPAPLGIEAEGHPIEFRNLRIKTL
jgi:hypothetical protein